MDDFSGKIPNAVYQKVANVKNKPMYFVPTVYISVRAGAAMSNIITELEPHSDEALVTIILQRFYYNSNILTVHGNVDKPLTFTQCC
jgi:hypothetical protein